MRTVKSLRGLDLVCYGAGPMTLTQTLRNRYKGPVSPPQAEVCGLWLHLGAPRPRARTSASRYRAGWNLYVGMGNGGMRPRHADLFATDLTSSTSDPLHRPAADVLCAHSGQAATHLGLWRTWRGPDYPSR